MSVLTPPARLIALLLVIVLGASACSSGSDEAAPAAEESSASASQDESDSSEPAESEADTVSASSEDCTAAQMANVVIRRDSGWLGSVTDEAGLVDGLGEPRDLQPLTDAVATLRPYQDLETDGFGTMREALDGIQSNIDAAQEGRFGDIEEIAVVVVIGSAVSEQICG